MRRLSWKLACTGMLCASPFAHAGDGAVPSPPPAASTPAGPAATTATVPVDQPVAAPADAVPSEPGFEYASEPERVSLFGLSRVHTVSPLSGLHPLGGIHRHPRCDAKDCDPFRNRCRPCDDKSYLAQGRPILERTNGKEVPDPAKGFMMLGGAPKCNVIIRDPDYNGGLVAQFPAYHPQAKEPIQTLAGAAEQSKEPAK